MASQENRKGGLGRGLASLITSTPTTRIGAGAADIVFGDSPTPQSAPRDASGAKINPILAQHMTATHENTDHSDFGASYQEIPIGLLIPNSKNPRKAFDDEELSELVHSIREFGLLQPIIVRPTGDDRYEIIMGERRWRASSKAGLTAIPAIVRNTDDENMLRDALLENIHRVQLNPLEEAAAYEQLLAEFNVTQHELADRLGRSRPVITNMLRLLQLPISVQRKIAAGVLTAGHARALLGLKAGKAAQEQLADRVVAESMSVRATEEAVTLFNRGEKVEKRTRTKQVTPEFFSRAAESLADNLETKVSVSVGKRKGKIIVEFGGQEDFERIYALLAHSQE
ncbi:ParB/RepB/Spo0J family partition protein [Corynebacterium sp. HS2168-gen11]|uniref:ParB/RepB/Spo0J family partition protein n=1 Tax=Corynebacterium sp. HS2168-gen11 TaxID=2974027 RepID=UPI00216AF652|nr:ParB/RepB/Spo0J family partition protein [Corynebacterium sp. HS2168-gen11]MCS4535483.1 ParB/RepB/Spo0J family partition protein [Corynebacterium sp. HS2168-gen11]